MTFKSVCLSLLALLVIAEMSQFFGATTAGSGAPFGTEAIPLNALITFVLVLLLAGGFYAATRRRLLQPGETLCIMYVLLLAAPLQTTGFWRYMLGAAESVVKEGDWEHYDALSPMLWPHGDDLIGVRIENAHDLGTTVTGNVHWENLASVPGKSHAMPVLENSGEVERSSIFFHLPVMDRDEVKVPLDEPYMLTMRARGEKLGLQTRYYVHLIYDDEPYYDLELYSSSDGKNVTLFQPEGFTRHGLYGFILPGSIKSQVTVEVGLTGPGRLVISDVNFFDVSALQGAYTGHRLVTAETLKHVPLAERTSLVVMPASLWSWAGLRYFISGGNVPWSQWRGPILLWGGYITLLLVATFALSTLLRRQWVENERFPLPLTQVPITLAGLEDELREGMSYLRSPYLWAGFGIMFFYTACNGLRYFFPVLPDLSVDIPLKAYLSDPRWGHTWEINFGFSGLCFALALFMDLNVLFSLIVGFFLLRFQYWFGEARGLTVDQFYPYTSEQNTGAMLTYSLVILFLARRFLFSTLRDAWRGVKSDEVLSPRWSYLVLAAALVGVGFWARWAGFGVTGPLALTVCVLLFLLVAMRLRAESGYTLSSFFNVANGGIQSLLFVFTVMGSVAFFNVQTAIFWGFFTMIFFNQACFGLIPGLQVELVALGHRLKLRRGDIVGACFLGIVGGLVIGGWVYLSSAYSIGANNYPIVGNFSQLAAFGYLAPIATTDPATSGVSPWGSWFDPQHLAFLFGAGVTALLSLMRQFYSGFWFHPFGFILGTTTMMQDSWGSILCAWAMRLAVLRLGGAVSVRERLYPFAVGCVLAILAVACVVSCLHGYAYFFNPGAPKPSDTY